ncbi:MAG: sodium:solute symporter family transporter, partial [Pyrinomonadaceae bacterium]
MKTIDLAIIIFYLGGVVLLGGLFARKQKTTRNYFYGGRRIPWWAIAASIVATETSTITFISVPGIAYARGGDFRFLQLVFGYMLGRVVISLLFIPSYFRGELLTVYQLLEERFGLKTKMLAASLFVVMRNIADGIRLLLTAIVLAAVYTAFKPEIDSEALIIGSIILIGLVMILFTYFGGMEAVIWIEVIQLGIYIFGALAAAIVLITKLPGGLTESFMVGAHYN